MWNIVYGWLIAIGLVALGTSITCFVKFIRRRGSDKDVGKMAAYSAAGVAVVAGLMFLASAAESSLPSPSKWWPFGTADKDLLTAILHNTAQHAKAADTSFQASLGAIESLRAGRPAYQVADLLKQQLEQLDSHVIQIARPYEKEAKEIGNATAREQAMEGIKAIHNAYDHRRVFVRNIQAAVNRGDRASFRATTKKRQEEGQALEEASAWMAIAHFIEAKKALGMPETLDEFER